jgi:hypothetical protein
MNILYRPNVRETSGQSRGVRREIEGLLEVSSADARIGEYGQFMYILQF